MVSAVVAFLLTLPATIIAVRLVLGWLRHKQILDHPNDRSSHARPTPRGGGLAVTPVVLLAWMGLILSGDVLPGVLTAIIAAGGLLALSWLDDRGGLPARLRLAAHGLACLAGLAAMPHDALLFQGALPFWADRLVALVGWIWFVNLTNFMDGIDGITGVQTASVGGGLALVAVLTAAPVGAVALPAVLVAASLGFLVWNWHPAKLFLGDSGSVPLGYLTGWLLIEAAGRGHLAAALILPLYYLADATITLGRRAWRGERLLEAHRQHFYQQAVRGAASHSQVALLILGANLLLVILSTQADATPGPALAGACAVVTVLLATLWRLGKGSKA